MNRNPNHLTAHPLNHHLYDDDEIALDSELVESIRDHGILDPLLVTPQGQILSGHRRWRVARHLGLDAVPVVVLEPADSEDAEIKLIEANRQRFKTGLQIAREVRHLKGLRLARQQPVSQRQIAQQVGTSQTTARRVVELNEKLEKLDREAPEVATQVRQTAQERGIMPALAQAQAQTYPDTPPPPKRAWRPSGTIRIDLDILGREDWSGAEKLLWHLIAAWSDPPPARALMAGALGWPPEKVAAWIDDHPDEVRRPDNGGRAPALKAPSTDALSALAGWESYPTGKTAADYAEVVDEMHRIDEVDWPRIGRIVAWAYQHWYPKYMQSPSKLRNRSRAYRELMTWQVIEGQLQGKDLLEKKNTVDDDELARVLGGA